MINISYIISLYLYSELPESLKQRIKNRYGSEAVDEIQYFQGNSLKVTFTSDKVKCLSIKQQNFTESVLEDF